MSFLASMDITKEPIVTVHTTSNRGHTPEEISSRCANRIIEISDNAHPAIQAQAREYRSRLEALLIMYMKEAIKLYNQAADKGFKISQSTLGDIYKNGDGVKKDIKKAFKFFKRFNFATKFFIRTGYNFRWIYPL